MNQSKTKIWMWYKYNQLCKAVYNEDDNSLSMYNEYDEMLIKRTNVSASLMKKIELFFNKNNAKRIDLSKDPFVFI
jgi:hypothetical protein